MIFYFSGTGNSLWTANRLNAQFDEKIVSISEALQKKRTVYQLSEEEKIFFVMPVHSWGPALLGLRFINNVVFENYNGQSCYAVFTCGDNCGYADKILSKSLRKRGITLTKSYSIQMPNNYILMKGFGVDPKNVEEKKLRNAPESLWKIVKNINEKSKEKVYTVGTFPFVKSRIVYPAFRKFAVKKVAFYATGKCISCSTCVEVCPTQTIVMEKIKPKWGNDCVQCTACINRCPAQAIEYGNITQEQGRYRHPDV